MKRYLIDCGFLLVRLISLLPSCVMSALGNLIGVFAYYVVAKRRNIGIKNLELCFPHMASNDRHKLIREHFKYLMTSALEYSLLFFASRRRIRRLVKIRNIDVLNQYYAKQAIILVCPHFVGLDLAASRLSQDYVGCSIYSQQKNPYITHKLHRARTRFMRDSGGEIFLRNHGLKPVIKKLRSSKPIFYYLPDQDFGERDSVYVPFFAHKNCATVSVLPRLVKLTGAVVIPMAVYKINNHYEIEFFAPWHNYPSDNLYDDVYRINQFVEQAIVPHPAQYFWLHKRFKSQPGLERGAIYRE